MQVVGCLGIAEASLTGEQAALKGKAKRAIGIPQRGGQPLQPGRQAGEETAALDKTAEQTASLTKQVGSLQNQVDAVNSRVTALNRRVTRLSERVSEGGG
jgi:phage shock protein A